MSSYKVNLNTDPHMEDISEWFTWTRKKKLDHERNGELESRRRSGNTDSGQRSHERDLDRELHERDLNQQSHRQMSESFYESTLENLTRRLEQSEQEHADIKKDIEKKLEHQRKEFYHEMSKWDSSAYNQFTRMIKYVKYKDESYAKEHDIDTTFLRRSPHHHHHQRKEHSDDESD